MIETDRLLLRRWKSADLEPFVRLNSDPRVMKYFPSILDRSQVEDFILRMEKQIDSRGFGFWACELKEEGSLIGAVGLNAPSFEASFTPCVEIGWRLSYEYWGRGLAPEAARAVIEFGFRKLGLTEILSWTSKENFQSQRVMEKIGMTRDPSSDFDHPRIPEGHWLRPHVLFRISK